ncbi:MAG: hypothetical protein WAM42_09300, partial [Candidatus Nitrosopolaris sp.]
MRGTYLHEARYTILEENKDVIRVEYLPKGSPNYNDFRYLSKKHIKPGIKIRSNSKVKSTNCHARNMSVVRQQTNLKRWKRSVSYGYRW